jgi:hypothetical protein
MPMIKNLTLKALILTIFMCFTALVSKAQLGYNYNQFDFGIAGGVDQVYGDAESVTATPTLHVSLNYNQTPYINYILEAQGGKLQGGNEYKDSSGRQFSNSFTAFLFRAQVQAGEIIDYSQSPFANAMKNFYLSSGIGYIVNHVTANRYSYLIPGYYTPGRNSSNEIFIPARIGYEFKLFNQYNIPNLKVDIAYQYNFVMGDDIDGYETGKSRDKFSQFTIGLKFAFGALTSYRKSIQF